MDLTRAEAFPSPIRRCPIAQAWAELGVSRATLYRQTQPEKPPALPEPTPSPRRLSDPERQAVLDVLHSEEFVVRRPPASVAINPLPVDDAAGETAAPKPTATTSAAPEPGATPTAVPLPPRPRSVGAESRNAPPSALPS
ncbi:MULTISPECIES: hypothetical protein [Sorangium]|uniref:hypothetical protein n=1 Tax=Sorangium TaxID=39643 RepID=UPI003D9C4010